MSEVPAKKDKTLSWVLGVGCLTPVALILIALVVIAVWPKDNGPRPGEAIAACENLVELHLKSPSTASFSSEITGDNPWTVRGVVDAQNSFGATVRANYQCTVRGTNATLDYLDE